MLFNCSVSAGFRPPEDAALFPHAKLQSFDGSAKLEAIKAKASSEEDQKAKESESKLAKQREVEQRWTRIVANDLENIPLGVAVMYGSMATAFSPAVHAFLALGFAFSR